MADVRLGLQEPVVIAVLRARRERRMLCRELDAGMVILTAGQARMLASMMVRIPVATAAEADLVTLLRERVAELPR